MSTQETWWGVPSEPTPTTPIERRDEVLAALARARAYLVEHGRAIALELAERNGSVTSIEVRAEMVARGFTMGGVDPRFLGAVVGGKGWVRVGWENKGHKARPVSRWRRA